MVAGAPMTPVIRLLFTLILLALLPATLHAGPDVAGTGVPILLYHRFGPVKADSMTVTTALFESHLRYLQENGYTVIPLRRLVDWLRKKAPAPPPRSVVIVADDAHRTVFTEMFPLVMKYRVPVTVFVYPSAIANASYAMTWDQLRELKQSGLVDIQSHTYWHPDFHRERRKLKPADYEKLVVMQLRKSREKLAREVGGAVDLLAWPFGIHDEPLEARAAAAGYVAAFTIERRHVRSGDRLMALPRYLLTDSDRGDLFARILRGTAPGKSSDYP